MKKNLCFGALLLSAGYASAQTWTQDFNATTPPSLPSGWMQNNVDGLTTPASQSSYSFGANAWVTHDFTATDPAHGKCVVSTSFYNPSGIANDWLITPAFNVPANAVLDWEGSLLDPNFPDGYLVKISTTGTNVADFNTTLMTVAAENLNWTARGVSLGAYAGQNVHIAFVNNSNDQYMLVLDNIRVSVPSQANDGSLTNITGLTRYVSAAGNQNIAGTFRSMGYAAASSMVINYRVNNSSVNTQTVTFGSALNYGQSTAYSFTTPAGIQLGTNQIKAWVSHINGVLEVNHANDTAYNYVYRSSTTRPRKALIEEFSSSSCGPCSTINPKFDTLLNLVNYANTPTSSVSAVKYQVNWPAPPVDPSNNSHVDTRVKHYSVFLAPTTLANGKTNMYFHTQSEINTAIAQPAYADITPTLNAIGSTIYASATITPYVTVSTPSPLRVHQVLAQHYYKYPGAFTTQKDYYNVMRKMFPDATGMPATATDGIPFTVSFNHNVTVAATPAQMSYDFWATVNPVPVVYEYVVFVQDSVTNDVLQSASTSYTVNGMATGLVQLKNDEQIGVYPNPAQDFAAVALKLTTASAVELNIVDVTGKVVYSKTAQVDAGQSEIKISTASFVPGVYTILLNNGTALYKEKLVVSR